MRKKDLASECVKQNLLPSTGNVLTSLDKNIIQKLVTDWDYISINKRGQSYYVGLTTDGMAFVYDKKNTFENFVNPTSIIWQEIETDYWKSFLKDSLNTFVKETNSKIGKSILDNFKDELKNFKQICPIEMLDKLKNPISLKTSVKKAS